MQASTERGTVTLHYKAAAVKAETADAGFCSTAH